MYSLRDILREFLGAPARARAQAEETVRKSTEAAAWLQRNVKESLMGVEASFGYYSSTLNLTAPIPADARRMMRSFGGKWDKTFNTTTGKFDFKRAEKVDGKDIVITVNASPKCTIRVVETIETSTYKVKRYVPEGDCGSILEDLPKK